MFPTSAGRIGVVKDFVCQINGHWCGSLLTRNLARLASLCKVYNWDITAPKTGENFRGIFGWVASSRSKPRPIDRRGGAAGDRAGGREAGSEAANGVIIASHGIPKH